MKIDVLGVQIDAFRKNEVLEKIQGLLDLNHQIFIVTPYSESLVSARNDSRYRDLLNSANISLPDGIGVLWSAHYLKYGNLFGSLLSVIFNKKKITDPIPEKISGREFIWDLARLAAEKGYSIFLLGGFGETAERVARKIKFRFPSLKIAGTYAGSPEEEGIVERINKSSADFVFVAFGPEKQEQWIYENLKKMRVKLAIGLGGTFDYIAGKKPPAPRFLASAGLEWLWRLVTQPWRFWRITRGLAGLILATAGERGKR